MSEVYKRILRPVYGMRLEVEYRLKEEIGELSIHGVSERACGQVLEDLLTGSPRPPWTRGACLHLYNIWKRWHLNTMRVGTPKQEEAIQKWSSNEASYGYKQACEYLTSVGLLVDNGHKYGSAWLKEEVPTDVLEWLFTLPGTGDTFSDIYTPEIEDKALDEILNTGKPL